MTGTIAMLSDGNYAALGDALRARLSGRVRSDLQVEGFAEAAVLVPIVLEPTQPGRVILTVRQALMRSHGGQIAFPGGKRDAADLDLESTAVRETTEELGIPAAAIETLGTLDVVPTPSGYNITPVVALIAGPVALVPSVGEVAEAFTVPLAWLLDPALYRSGGEREFRGVTYEMHEYHVDARRIWGATARILWQLLSILG